MRACVRACLRAYLGCGCFSQTEEEAVETWNRTKGIDEVTILERQRDSEREREREKSNI